MKEPHEFELEDENETAGASGKPESGRDMHERDDTQWDEPAPENAGKGEEAEKPGKPGNRLLKLSLILLVVFAAARVFIAAVVPLLAAESYYWLWSTRLAAGYYDHPPMIAYWIRLGTELIGETELGVRLLPLVLNTLVIFIFYLLCREMLRDRRAALVGLLFGVFAPFYIPFATGATPDAPLMFFWTLALWTFIVGYKRDNPWLWLAAGISTGLAIISKYNGFQLPIVFFAFLLITPRGRQYLRRPAPYMALLAAALVAAPNIIWTLNRGGSTMGIPFRAGLSLEEAKTNILAFLSLIPLWLTPFLALAWVWGTLRGIFNRQTRRDEMFIFGLCAGWLPLLMFAGLAPARFIHAQWVAPCFVAAAPMALAAFASDRKRGWSWPGRRFTGFGAAFGGVLMALLLVAPALVIHFAPLDGKGLITQHMSRLKEEFHGWDQLADRLNAEIDRHDDGRFMLASSNYHRLTTAMWLTGNRIPGLPMRKGERFGQFIYWYEEGMYNGWDALIFEKGGDSGSLQLALEVFEEVEVIEPERVISDGREIRSFDLFIGRGFRGPKARNGGE